MSRAQGWLRAATRTFFATAIGTILSGIVAAQTVGTITTVAGGGPGTMEAIEASLRGNSKVVADGSGNLYVSDGIGHRVFRFDRQSGRLSPFAGTGFRGQSGDGGPALQAQLDNPYALALDEANGVLYVQDNGVIRAVALASGTISRFAGGGSLAPADGMLATQVLLASIGDIAVAQGVVYVADTGGSRVWAIDESVLRAAAGNGVARGALDGPGGNPADDYRDGVAATDASLGTVSAVAVSGQSLYFFEGASLAIGGARYRRVDLATGTLTTYAGNGHVYGFFDGPGGDPRDDVVESAPALQAALGQTTALVVDPLSGDLYGLIRSPGLVRRVSANGDGTAGTIATVFGGGTVAPTYVAPTAARLLNPTGLARDGDGALYVADRVDFEAYTVYESDGSFAFPVVGNGYAGYCGDGGPADAACLSAPTGARPDGTGQLWIADDGNRVIRLVGPSGAISSLMPQGRMLATATDLWPLGGGRFLFSSPARHLVFSVEAPYESGLIFAGTGVPTGSEDGEGGDLEDDLNDGELAWVASLKSPAGLARDARGNTFIADAGNHRVRRVDAVNSLISTVAGTGAPGLDESQGQPATATAFFTPYALAFEADGDLLVAERDGHRVRRIRAGADGLVTGGADETVELVAGAGPSDEKGFAGDGGPALGARLDTPTGLAVDVLGDIYIADSGNHAIRRVHALSGIVDTIAGRGDGGDGVPAAQSRLEQIGGLSTDVVNGRSYLYVTDTGQNRVRSIDLGPATGPVNQPPVIEAMTNDGAVVTATSPAGILFALYVLASDPDGDPLTYNWSGPFGSASGFGIAVRMPIGVNTVTLEVDDGHGHVVTGTATITVLGENTFTGSGEVVTPPDDHQREFQGETPGRVTATFLGPVTHPGLTWLRTRTDQTPPPPAGKQLGSAPLYYDVATTAVATGDVRICLDLTGMSFAFPAQVELHRLAGAWSGLGVSPDTLSHQVCVQAPFAQVFGTYANFTPADPGSIVVTVAGTGTAEDTGDGGPANQAGLNIPVGLAFDRARNLLYIGEGSHRVRRVNVASGQIATIAGTGTFEDPVDGIDARLSSIGSISGLAVDADGNLFVSDPSHCLIRRVDVQTNVITTVAGSWRGPGLTCGHSGDGAAATAARVGSPYSLAFDSTGDLYFSELPTLAGSSGGYVRRIAAGADGRITGSDPAELIATVAGNGQQDTVAPDAVHPLDAGIFPQGVALGPDGSLYVVENNGVLRVSPGADGSVNGSVDEIATRVLGSTLGYNLPFQGDGGPARSAYSAWPSGVAVLPSGDVLVVDRAFRRIRRVSTGADGVVDGSPDEVVTTVAGFSDNSEPPGFNGDGYALTTRFAFPTDVIHDGADAIYVSDPAFHRVRRLGVPSGGGGGGNPRSDLAVSASAAPDPVGSGSLLTFTATVANLGPDSAHGVRLSMPIPATAGFIGSSSAGACTGPAPGSAGAIVCALGDLAASASTTLTIETRPTGAGPLATTLTGSASETDPNPANNSVTVSVGLRLDPVVLDVLETIVVSDTPALTPSVMLEVPETIVVTDAPALTPSVMLEVPETIVVSDTPSIRDATPPSVTINQSAWQADPTSASPIEFTVLFSEPVSGFDASDVSFTGSTVGGSPSAVVAGAVASYIVSVTGVSGAGTVVASIPAGAAVDADGNASLASTSVDNQVTLILAAVPTTTSLTSSRNPSLTTASPIFTATVASQPGVPPTGQVEFSSDGVAFGRSPLFERGGQFVAVLGGAHLAVTGSPHTITARYLGDTAHLASDSAPVAQVVHEGTYFVENVSGAPARLVPVAFNDAGQIAGNLTTSSGLTAGLFDPVQGYRRLDPVSDFSEAFDLNAAGTVVGRSGPDAVNTSGFADRNGVLEVIPASVSAVGVNGREQIAINLENGNGAAIYQGSVTPLDNFEARAIDEAGLVAGAVTGGDGQPEAVLWWAGALDGLGRFGQAFSSASRVNNAGTVLVQTGELGGDESALLYRGGAQTPLGTGRAWDVNDADVVVGGTDEARVYLGETSIRLANGPVAGMAINDRGEIVASVANQLQRWTPVPTSALVVSPVSTLEEGEITLTAILTSQGAPAAGQTVVFSLNGHVVGSGTTGPDGVATFTEVFFGLPIGVLPDGVRASFAGSRTLGASTAAASLTVQAINPADLSVSASLMASTVPVTVGSNVVYVVSMANNGPSSAIELRLNVTLPAGLQFVSDTGQGACSWSPGLGTCDFGGLAAGATRTLTIVARPLTPGPLTAIFTVSSPRFDPVPLNNTRFVTIDPRPTVTINQAPGQPDPTSASPIRFSVVFSEPVTGFGASDVSFAGSLAGGALTATVTGSGANYTVAVTGMSAVGLVAVSIPAGAAVDSGGNPNLASTSTDRTVLFQPNTVIGFVSPSNGGNVVLAIVDSGGQPSGVLSYSKGSVSYTATRITSLVISGQTATIEGFSSNGRLFVAWAFDGGSGQPDRFRLWIEGVEQTPATGSLASGSLTVQPWAADTRLKGWVDLHTHPMSNIAFGGKLFHGAPSVDSLVPAVQMPGENCRIDERARSIDEALSNDSFTRGVASCGGNFARALMIGAVEQFNGALSPPGGAVGYPAFTDWPRWNDITHQKMWVDWIRRAWQYGQRVMVALSHNNRSLADLLVMGGGPVTGVTGDEASSALQINEIKRLVATNSAFMAVARTPDELRSIVESDRMAIVLGVELDNLGDLNRAPELSEAVVNQKIQELFDADVRYVLPVHFTDNVFGDSALHNDLFNVLNLRETGAFFRIGCAQLADEVGYEASGIPALLNLFLPPSVPPFTVPSCRLGPPGPNQFLGHVNANLRTATGLTTLGEFALRAMMKRGMIVDIDHMSDRAVNRTLAIATAVPNGGYPVMSGHTGVRDRNVSNLRAENSRTTAQLARVACLGGMFGLGTDGVRAVDWAGQYARAYDVMRRAFGPGGQCPQSNPLGTGLIGLGTDTNSLVKTPRSTMNDLPSLPRFTPIYDPNNAANQGVTPLGKSRTGTREWDYNLDGVAHYGMFADFLRDVRTLPGATVPVRASMTPRQIVDDQMMYGADYFYRSWLKADTQKIRVP